MRAAGLVFALACLWALPVDAGRRVAAEDLRIGVAPFAGPAPSETTQATSSGPEVAGMLAEHFDEIGLGSVVPPSEFPRSAPADVEASEVRRWASRSQVDTVVVGEELLRASGIEIRAELRSGHSGAVISRYAVQAEGPEGLRDASRELGDQVLSGLGYAPPDPEAAARKAARRAEREESRNPETDDDAEGVAIGGAKRDQPISIRSDELEMIQPPRGPRKVIFTDNVVVLQGEVRLTTDELTAVYPEGSSQPEELIAVGTVLVEKGDKQARCDRARYQKALDRIICTGHAELVERCDRVRGEEIHIDLVRERIRVMGAPSVVVHPDDSKATGECIGAES